MTNLKQLTVSLTKHGAHKVARLIDTLPVSAVLDNINNDTLNVHIDLALTKKVLSVYQGKQVPVLWEYAKRRGPATVNALTLISIIFAHHELINAFIKSTDKAHHGSIRREQVSSTKGYTNLSNNVFELGYATERQVSQFSYDFAPLFDIHGLGALVGEILSVKLREAGWPNDNALTDESIRHDFHKVFGLTEDEFTEWLVSGTIGREAPDINQIDDIDFLTTDGASSAKVPFEFRSGHSPRKEGESTAATRDSAYTSTLLHNEIQNSLFLKLKAEYGSDCVGTENNTGVGTSIDLVVKTDAFCWFYEIKTASTAKLCIRQAIPQLLEYAYWSGDTDLADKLVIVSHNNIDDDSQAYLTLLRETFGLNLHYEKHAP